MNLNERSVMRKQSEVLVAVLIVVSLLAAACGGDDGGAADEPEQSSTTAAEPDQPEPDEPEPTTSESTTTEPTTAGPSDDDSTGDDAVTYASLSPDQQRVVGGICEAVVASAEGGFSWGDTWILSVLSGEAGVPALEAAFAELDPGPDPGPFVEAAGPICDEIGWAPPA